MAAPECGEVEVGPRGGGLPVGAPGLGPPRGGHPPAPVPLYPASRIRGSSLRCRPGGMTYSPVSPVAIPEHGQEPPDAIKRDLHRTDDTGALGETFKSASKSTGCAAMGWKAHSLPAQPPAAATTPWTFGGNLGHQRAGDPFGSCQITRPSAGRGQHLPRHPALVAGRGRDVRDPAGPSRRTGTAAARRD